VRRGFWFAAGAGAGIYVMVRARRAVETFTPDGVRDRLAGLGVGAHLFADEVRAGMAERETELRTRLGLGLDGPLELSPPAGEVPVLPPGGFEARFARTSTTDEMEGTH
jgi:hypothetical protein